MYKFISSSHACLNVTLPNGTNKHISFTEVTGGTSFFITDNAMIAKALRRHPRFGRLFKEVAVEKPAPKQEEKSDSAKADDGKLKLTFANNEEAKDYISDTYGISRSKMRTTAAIEEVAKSLDLEIIWKR